MTLDEFLEWEALPRHDDERYELIDGVPVAMAEAGVPHAEIMARTIHALMSRVQPRWRVLGKCSCAYPIGLCVAIGPTSASSAHRALLSGNRHPSMARP